MGREHGALKKEKSTQEIESRRLTHAKLKFDFNDMAKEPSRNVSKKGPPPYQPIQNK